MKKFFAVLLSGVLLVSVAACSQPSGVVQDSVRKVTVQSSNGRETVDVEVPHDPERVAVLDMAVLDVLDSWGLGDRVVGVPKSTTVDYLKKYNDDQEVKNLGSVKEVDLEGLMSSKPDVIFIGSRLADEYDKLSEIAPVVLLSTDYKAGYVQSYKDNLLTIASIFGVEDKAKDQFSGVDERVSRLREAAAGKSAVMGMVTSSNFNTLGNNSAGSVIFNEVGMKNLADKVDSTHGDTASLELLVDLNPDYVFVLDRDSAISKNGAQTAEQVMDNELVKKTDAYKNQHVVYLSPAVWYLVTGGVTATDAMLTDLENSLLPQE